MKAKKIEAITLLNDGKTDKKEGHCNSWPVVDQYLDYSFPELCRP